MSDERVAPGPERVAGRAVDSAMTVTATAADLDGVRTEIDLHPTDVPQVLGGSEGPAGLVTSLDRFAASGDRLTTTSRS